MLKTQAERDLYLEHMRRVAEDIQKLGGRHAGMVTTPGRQPWGGATVPCPDCEGNVRIKVQPRPAILTADRMPTNFKAAAPLMGPIRWAVGVTTVPERRDTLLPATLASIQSGGFEVNRLFIDGGFNSQTDGNWKRFEIPMTDRWPRIKLWGNWWLGMQELYIRDPHAHLYAMFQDDLTMSRNVRQYLEALAVGGGLPDHGYLNLFTFLSNEAVIRGMPEGWHECGPIMEPANVELHNLRMYPGQAAPLQAGRGALAYVFTVEALQVLFMSWQGVSRPTAVGGRDPTRNIDGGVPDAMNRSGWREWVHNPSLVDHTGKESTHANDPKRGCLMVGANSFRGAEFNVMELLKGE